MWHSLQAPLFFGLIAMLCSTIGLIFVAFRTSWTENHSSMVGLAAAGLLSILVFLHILPEAFALSSLAPIWLAVGFFFGLLLNNTVKAVFPAPTHRVSRREAVTPILAIGIHSFLDGIIYAVTFAASFESGMYTAVGLTLHEFPEGVIAFAILRRYGVSNVRAFIFAFLSAAATTPLGVVVAGPFMYGLGSDAIGSLFAVSAGLLIYVATGPLMAPLREMPTARGLASVLVGAGAGVLLVMSPVRGHSHFDHDHSGDHAEPVEGHHHGPLNH